MKRSALIVGLLVLAACCVATPAPGQPPTTSGGSGQALLNLHNTVAVHGYDVVAYFNQNRAWKGSRRIKQSLGMANYYFATWRNRYQFLRDAPKYQPQFGGYCTLAMAVGRLEDIDPNAFTVYQGKLYLFRDENAKNAFLKDPDHIIYQAAANYFEIARERREY